jgi:phosphoglycerol transferase
MSFLRTAALPGKRRFSIAKSALLYPVQAIVVLAIAFKILKLGAYDLKVPFNYDGDSMVILMYIKGMLLNGWTFTIPQLSAPFELDAAAFPIMSNVDWLVMKAISLFTAEPGMVLNIFWLLTLVLSAASAALSLRLLGLGLIYSLGAGVLYAFLPFALMRNVAHLNLVYYIVPLLGLLAVHIANGLAGEKDRLIRCIAYAACVAQGFDYVYYSFFAVLILAFAAIVGYAGTRSRRVIVVAATAIGLLIGATSLNLAPSLFSWYSVGKPVEMNYKSPSEAETYGAKIRKMIAPNPGNPVSLLAEWGTRDQTNAYANENENVTARLGLAASAGFILLLLVSLGTLRLPRDEAGAMLGRLAPLSLFTLLFITVGGFGAVFNLFFSADIRAYNRFSVFLAFFALAGLGFVLQAWTDGRLGRRLAAPTAALLLAFSLYDQLLDCNLPTRAADDARQYRADRAIAARFQSLYPRGASILELPLTGFPPAYHHERMVSYDHLRPFLWSGANLRWSWPSFSQRHRAWQDRLAATAPQATVDAAVLSDFDAILVDRYAFKDDAKQLVAAFEAAGATRQFEHTRYVILDLANAKHQLLSRLGQTAFARQREEWLEPVRLLWDSGFYEPEATPAGASFRWSSQRSRLVVFNDSQRSRKLRMDFDVVSQGVGTVEVDDGRRHWTIDSQSAPRHASLELLIAPATKTILSFRGNVQRVVAPADPRALYFNIQNFAYAELAKDTRDSAAVADTREQPR